MLSWPREAQGPRKGKDPHVFSLASLTLPDSSVSTWACQISHCPPSSKTHGASPSQGRLVLGTVTEGDKWALQELALHSPRPANWFDYLQQLAINGNSSFQFLRPKSLESSLTLIFLVCPTFNPSSIASPFKIHPETFHSLPGPLIPL